ncbi:DNA-binding Lrp family transcriptional regulator [Hydrogenispora ethanolica]|uniref:siroheme decarboxylase n=1 Tax=Hydrogenispora ethanolica TaxID=1082276 RepID=A0A4R1RW53_HYDET|nr:AsnC family transcriptional regulator [Hydrogenispora ethanolica]TCL70908.1 DNA-binding Lrp family transcriptional regulator [Hydrogenispora ethanolica]
MLSRCGLKMDAIDRKLLNRVQAGLPLTEQPFHEVAEELGIAPDEVIQRLTALKEKGFIRRFGGLFNSRRLGYSSTLLAMAVPEERLDEVAAVINSFPGVTHNYRRQNRLNIWFTLATRDPSEKEVILGSIRFQTGLEPMEFPAERIFKLNVFFDLERSSADAP